MLFNFAKYSNTLILLAISAVHFYWAMGGRWGLVNSLPELEGKKVLKPSILACVVVALGLLYFAIQTFVSFKPIYKGLSPFVVPHWSTLYTVWAMVFIFFIRAVGDFKYVGFFKKINDSRFAQLDTRYYSPLCLFMSINAFILALGMKGIVNF